MTGYKLAKELMVQIKQKTISWNAFGFGHYVIEIWNLNKHEPFELNISDISFDTSLSRTSVKNYILELEKIGFIQQIVGVPKWNNVKKYNITCCTKNGHPVEQIMVNQTIPVDQPVAQNMVNPTYSRLKTLKPIINKSEFSVDEKNIDFWMNDFTNQTEHWIRFCDAHGIDESTLQSKHIEFRIQSISIPVIYPNLYKVNSHFLNWFLSTKKYKTKKMSKYGGKSPAQWMLDNGFID